MSVAYARHIAPSTTPQTESLFGKPMVKNSAGGFTFEVDDWTRLERFLILGAEGGSYYSSERKLTIENATCVQRCLDLDAARAVNTIVDISVAGRAPKNDPAVFALAIASAHPVAKQYAFEALPKVCRIGTHLFQYVAAVNELRGWGKGLRKAVSAWYEGKTIDQLAHQVAKYQQRDGWSHADVLRLAHPPGGPRDAVYRWALKQEVRSDREVKGKDGAEPRRYGSAGSLPAFLAAVDEAKTADRRRVVALIDEFGLPRECVPTLHLNEPDVWEALLVDMPMNAMVRNLGKMSSIGLLKPLSDAAKTVADRLGDKDHIQKSRLHPMAILISAKQYGQGRGDKGSLTWSPVGVVNDALDAAFYLAFHNVVPSGKRIMLAVDVSGSMSDSCAGSPLSCREAAAANVMVTARTEPQHQIVAFAARENGQAGGRFGGGDPRLAVMDISSCQRLSDVMATLEAVPMGGTDCSLPMRAAQHSNITADAFVVLTDNETWAGPVHPCEALRQYRKVTGIPAKLVVQAFTATPFTIADPSDAGTLDVVGFDASTPSIIADFIRQGAA